MAAATTAAVLVSGLVGAPAPAVPSAAARSWSALMSRSLNPSDGGLKAVLAGLRTAVPARAADQARARRRLSTARTRLAAATPADAAAQAMYGAAQEALAGAQRTLTAARKATAARAATKADRTRLARARQQVRTATAELRRRSAAAAATASALGKAQAAVETTTQDLDAATVAWRTANVAVRNTQLKVDALPKFDPATAAQAAAIGQTVVTETRSAFKVADTTRVDGVTVNKIVAYAFGRMISAAGRDGIQLSGGGFRTRAQQIRLRTLNGCPDVWTAPASSCKVPTAIPGRSLHEIGLAVDMSSGQKTIKDRTSPAFRWLTAHAIQYGFVNLPSEPWHWSITGG
jgi:D-alanyl-D-alanine carboxypeptidase